MHLGMVRVPLTPLIQKKGVDILGKQHFRWIFLGTICLMLVSCNLKLASETLSITPTSQSTETKVDSIPEATVTFRVQIPTDSPSGQPIQLSLLDEVTGLALNVRRYEMQAVDDLHYQIELSLPRGTTIKYRYGRQGDYLVEEHSSIQEPVRYRLYRVDGSGVVEDIVSAWSDTTHTGSLGRIMGTARDSITGRPVPDLLVCAGGMQTLTSSDGSFLIEGLPPGIHNLVVYAIDGAYRTFQQGAQVAVDSSTLAPIQVVAAPQIPVTFNLQVPEDTIQGIPLRLAGNLRQLGNTFADLTGGTNTLAAHMPLLKPETEGHYQLSINLPAGADIAYKYTLGDGFWNAEHTASGDLKLRRLIVPETPLVVQDQVDSWGSGFYPGPLIFDLTLSVPTPPNDTVSIQFNPFGWTEPIAMWPLGDQRWTFALYNPIQSGSKFAYRYCRNDQCGSADDGLTPGAEDPGRVVEILQGSQTIHDSIESWAWWDGEEDISLEETEVVPRNPDFIAGVEFQPDYHPSWSAYRPETFTDVQSLRANWILLTPSWTFTRSDPVILEPVLGKDPTWEDAANDIIQARNLGFKVALFPTPHFPIDKSEWWETTSRDFAWWLVWFENYRSFLLHHADLAQINGAQALVLGGDWVQPAFPGGTLPDGSLSNIPADAESRWEGLLVEVRERFKGQIIWALPADPTSLARYPAFIKSMDMIYLVWSLPLASSSGQTQDQMYKSTQVYLDTEVIQLRDSLNKPIVLGITYPSAEGAMSGCIADPDSLVSDKCLDYDQLSRPQPDIPEVPLNLEEQYVAYEAVLRTINERDWIAGVVSRGYYPPVKLQDKSLSIHGKPVENLLEYWFSRWLNLPK